jgi:hypothetical protein
MATLPIKQQNFSPLLLAFFYGSGIRDGKKSGSGMNILESVPLIKIHLSLNRFSSFGDPCFFLKRGSTL